MSINYGGFAGGLTQGMALGQQLRSAFQQNEIDKVRAQGIAEAKAAQAAATPAVTDGNALSSAPQASVPEPAPVNTDLSQVAAFQPQGQSEGEVSTVPVAAPTTTDTSKLSSMPMASADPAPAAAGVTIKGAKRYRVGDAGFDTLDQAQAHAASQAPDLDTLIRQKLVPKMKEAYLKQGNPDKADAWQAWADAGEGRARAKTWAEAYAAAQAGDDDKAAKAIMKLHGHLDDGTTMLGTEKVQDKAGNVTGFNMTWKDDANGQEQTQFVDRDALIEHGLSSLSPQAMFEQTYKAKAAREALAAKEAVDARNDARTYKRTIDGKLIDERKAKEVAVTKAENDKTLENLKSSNRIERDNVDSQRKPAETAAAVKAKVAAQAQILRDNGQSEDAIKTLIPSLLGTGEYRKAVSPEELRRQLTGKLGDDPRNMKKSEAELGAIVDKMMRVAASGQPASAPSTSGPAAGGVKRPPSAAPSAAPAGAQMVYDPATKQLVPMLRR